jgi:hypothetical protein
MGPPFGLIRHAVVYIINAAVLYPVRILARLGGHFSVSLQFWPVSLWFMEPERNKILNFGVTLSKHDAEENKNIDS